MAESSSISKRPQLKQSFSYSFSSNNIFPESPKNQQINQSSLSYTPQENNDNPFSSIHHHKKSKSNTFSSIFSRSSSFMRRRRTETYQENDEFTNGCFGFLCTLGSKIKYKINNTWKGVKSKCKGKFSKKRSLDQDDWKTKAITLNQNL
ncbi:hypothetical protein RhiirA1_424749 [Rhizophagus irregularis]|uniref:Uncharacterized protein n=1 Tax=Rhizophagus irregularis TaxID=588596 RepID=A0A2I1ERT0_9GLOM|nr:hypothetical protein RhiirA1_424749 [Rhizophagus irregularis]PKY24839.1 hypothetical protein RhiirB3_413435 [Rhizophagus irregularis]CAB4479480.1 unnamed protein product [Rhizophagus irregularis]CAB5364526.1 unnamed protein product [Rhizophagus irregularis]